MYGIVAVLFALAFVALAAIVGGGPLPIDLSIRDALHVGGPVPPVLDLLSIIGSPVIWDAGVAVLIAGLWFARRHVEAAWIGGGLLAAEVLATAIKIVVDRPRPPGIIVSDLVTQASFPSGHVTRAAVTGALLVLVWPWGRRSRVLVAVAAVAVAVLMGLARIVAGEHWPTDVAGAYLFVAALTAGAAAVMDRLRRSAPVRRGMPAPGTDEAEPPP